MEQSVKIRITCDTNNLDVVNEAIETLKNRIERMGTTHGTIENVNYTIEIN